MISWCGRRFGRGRSGLAAAMAVLVAMLGAAGLRAGPGERAKAPASPEEAVRRLTLPPGFKATLFAGRARRRPADRLHDRPAGPALGRRELSYPIWLGGPQGKDRIVIFEDTDGDGRFDRRTVFCRQGDELHRHRARASAASGSARRRTCSSFPIATATTSPTAPPSVVLDGWRHQGTAQHVQRPELGPRRLALGLQRHHRHLAGRPARHARRRSACRSTAASGAITPTRKIFEAVAHGTTNPWGLDFDDIGEAFITNCVIAHLFHVVPGAHFQRMFGQDFNPQRLRPDRHAAPTTSTGRRPLERLREGRPRQAQRGRRRPRPRAAR